MPGQPQPLAPGPLCGAQDFVGHIDKVSSPREMPPASRHAATSGAASPGLEWLCSMVRLWAWDAPTALLVRDKRMFCRNVGWSGPLTRVHQTLLQVLQLTQGQSMLDPGTAVGAGLQSVSLQTLPNYPITAFKRLWQLPSWGRLSLARLRKPLSSTAALKSVQTPLPLSDVYETWSRK